MLPNGWKKTTLGRCVDIKSGVAPSTLTLKGKGKYPYVKVEDMNNCSKFQKDSRQYTDFNKNYTKSGAVIFPKRGAAIMNNKVRISVNEIYLDSNMMALCPNKNATSEFLYYTILFCGLFKIADTSTIPQINNKHILPYSIHLPPLAEQKKIAAILSTWDRAIEGTEKLLANSQQQKKALMQQLLTAKKRLPGFSGKWEFGMLSDIAQIDTGFAFKSTDFTDDANDVPVIRMSDLKDGKLNLDSCKKLSSNKLFKLTKFALKEDDFVFGMSGSLSNFAWITKQSLPCYLNQRVGRVRSKDTGDQKFISYLYLSEKIQKEIEDKAAGAAQLNISLNDIRRITIQLPPLPEQRAIAAVLTTADDEITAIESDLARLRQEKKALMQQLLTGKRRVKID